MTMSADVYRRMVEVAHAETARFNDLVRAAGLDPECDFRRALLTCDLRGEDLNAYDFTDARFQGCDLRGADLTRARGVTAEMLRTAKWDATTKLPFVVHGNVAGDVQAYELGLRGIDLLASDEPEEGAATPAAAPEGSPDGAGLLNNLSALGRLEAALDRFEPAFARIIDESSRSWHGINPYTGEAEPLPGRIKDRPTELLLARYRVVPFLDRGGLLAGLLAWATAPSERRAQGRLYVAAGGFGKTRLGIELILELKRLGWRCSFLSQMNASIVAPGSLPDLLRPDGAAGACVVVDYAESQDERLRILANAAHMAPRQGPPIRLIAFARSAGAWWEGLFGDPGPSTVFDPKPFEDVGAALSQADQIALFTRSRMAFANRLRTLDLAYREQPGVLDPSDAERPLTIAAAAFLDARGVERKGASLFQTLYEEERRNWRRVLGGLRPDAGSLPPDAPDVDDLARAATQITLVQGAYEDGATALIKADPSDRTVSAPHVMTALRRLYGRQVTVLGPEPGEEIQRVFIGAIEPDLLGEHTAMTVLAHAGTKLLGATLRSALSGPPLFANGPAKIITVLTRATHPTHDRIVRETAEKMIGGLGSVAATLPADDLGRLYAAIPQASVALLEPSAAIAGRLVDLASKDDADEAKVRRAIALNNLGIRLSDLGRREDALAKSEEAAGLYRELAGRNRDAFLPDLARALHNMSRDLSNLGRREDALAASEEAVRLRRELAGRNRDAFLPNLARALGPYGRALLAAERADDAAAAFQEGARLLRPMAAALPDAFGGLFQALVQGMEGALRAAGRAGEIEAARAELGLGGESQGC